MRRFGCFEILKSEFVTEGSCSLKIQLSLVCTILKEFNESRSIKLLYYFIISMINDEYHECHDEIGTENPVS